MSNDSFDDGSLRGTRPPETEWEKSQVALGGIGHAPAKPASSHGQPFAMPVTPQYQSPASAGPTSSSDDPRAVAKFCLVMVGMLFLYDFYWKFGTPPVFIDWAIRTGAEVGALTLMIVIACFAPTVIAWPVALALLGADMVVMLPHQVPWLFKAPLVLPSWWPVWSFELFMVALRVIVLFAGVGAIRSSRKGRA